MIDPVIFEFNLLGLPIILRWYGVLVMLGAVVGALIAEREIKRRGENGESVWDALVWILPAGIIGARLWYVLNSILGGSNYYTSQPAKILYIWEGGLHFFGGLLLGAIALYYYLKQNGMDFWLFLDAIAPAALIGQALARPANFINQELYGQPTKLMWGIPIDASHRLPQFSDLTQFPVETTRFHPTFAYEMILNILLALLLLWISRRYAEKMKPGAIFAGWLISAGLIRAFIEFFRPDQPRIGDSIVTYSMFVSILMAISGVVLLLIRYGKLQLAAADGWEEQYQIKPVEKKARTRSEKSNVEDEAFVNDLNGEVVAEPETKVRVVKSKTPEKKPSKKKVSEEKKAPVKRSKTVK
ncbi:MAG TPA: prolipoprotein diacylglyceryl transferase [Anaerolineales bacterium]|nr:prolipoprotein diacylglyceryl transferase [Anaerolineales bacterium]